MAQLDPVALPSLATLALNVMSCDFPLSSEIWKVPKADGPSLSAPVDTGSQKLNSKPVRSDAQAILFIKFPP